MVCLQLKGITVFFVFVFNAILLDFLDVKSPINCRESLWQMVTHYKWKMMTINKLNNDYKGNGPKEANM